MLCTHTHVTRIFVCITGHAHASYFLHFHTPIDIFESSIWWWWDFCCYCWSNRRCVRTHAHTQTHGHTHKHSCHILYVHHYYNLVKCASSSALNPYLFSTIVVARGTSSITMVKPLLAPVFLIRIRVSCV